MTIIIPDNHPTLTLSPYLNDALQSHFRQSPITYIQYLKVHHDGAMSILTNRPDWIQAAMKRKERKVYSCANREFLDKNSYWFLWDYNLPDAPLGLAREYDISNGICFVERYQDHYYLTAYATPTCCHDALTFYLNNLTELKKFSQYWRDSNSQILSLLDKNKIALSLKDQDPNKDTLLISKSSRIPVFFNRMRSYITPQEYECIKRLPSGKTSKDIARDLNISHRTVEGYFNRVMMRVGCENRKELILLLNQEKIILS